MFKDRFSLAELYIYLLLISAFISISLFEGFVILGTVYTIFNLFRRRTFWGILRYPLLMYILSTIVSTLIYFSKMLFKSIEEGLFQITYFLFGRDSLAEYKKLSERLAGIIVLLGVLLLPVFFYNYINGNIKLLWGGRFEVGNFYSIFSITSLLLSLKHRTDKRFLYGLLFLSALFFTVVVLSHRRSALLAFSVVLFLFLIVLTRNGVIGKRVFISLLVAAFFFLSGAYLYLSQKDVRFKVLNEVLLGKKEVSAQTLNVISSSRYNIMLDGIAIVRRDIEEGNVLNLLIGHGVRSGLYLPHKYSPPGWQRYESVFLISEFIEKGALGLLGIILIFFYTFKRVLTLRLPADELLITSILFTPLLFHLVGTLFTFFWDALLPLYLLLFKIGEVGYERSRV